jgi:DNA polymerase III epsilon subunit-like protein
MNAVLVAFDIETTGSRMMLHGMIELGAVAIDVNSNVLSRFSVEIKLDEKRTWEKRCLEEFWCNKSWKTLPEETNEQKLFKKEKKRVYKCLKQKVERVVKGEGHEPPKAMKMFVEWMDEIGAKYGEDNIQFISDTVSFDSSWINYYLEYCDHAPLHIFFNNKFKDVICTRSYAQGISHISHQKARSIEVESNWYSRDNHCREILGIPNEIRPLALHDHTSVNDAQFIAEEHLIHVKYGCKT